MALKSKPTGILLPMRVWDGATRLFHWMLVLLVLTSYISISVADGPRAGLWMKVHLVSGEAVLALLIFRILWGVFGSDTARFKTFLRGPAAALGHLRHFGRREPDHQVGHNAAGGWMVVALLVLMMTQVGTGLFANDDGTTEGPLMRFVSKATSDQLSSLHGLTFNILAAAIGLHIAAVVAYLLLKKQNLTKAMVTGKKRLPAITAAPRLLSPWLALVTLAVSAGVTVLISRL